MAKIGFSEKGLVMPHNKELEQNIIFSVLKDSTETFDIIAGFFKSDAFYYPDYKIIYDCAYAMYNQNMTVDLFTIATELEKEKKLAQIGGLPELLNLSNMFVTNANIEYYARIVMEKYIKRYLISLGNDLNVNGYDSSLSAFDVIEKIEKEINELVEIGSKDYEKIDPYNDVFEEIRNSIQNRIDGIKTGIPSGFKELDAITSGWQKSDLIVVGGRPGMGKELNNNSLICTPTGFRRIDELKVGDKVIGSNGKPCNVIGVFPQGIKDIYNVHFDDNTMVEAGLEHQWEVTSRSVRKTKNKKPIVLTTKDMLSSVLCKDGRKNYSIKFCQAIEYESKPIILNPYVLGAYIGDGYSYKNTSMISNSEIDVLNKFNENLPKGLKLSSKNHNYDYGIINTDRSNKFSFCYYLDLLGLKNKKSYEKFIPKEYLYNSIEVRQSLLQGLIDTDGYVFGKGTSAIEYTTTSYQLCLDVLNLVRGLGGKATYQEKQGSYKKDNIKHIGRTYYRMYLSLPGDIIPVSSKKHLEKYNSFKKYHSKFITKIEKTGKQCEMTCISVDAEDCLYIVGDGYTLTHNTALSLAFAINAIKNNKKTAFFSLEMSSSQILKRFISFDTLIPLKNIIQGNLSTDELSVITDSITRIKNKNLYINDTSALNIFDFKRICKKLKKEEGIDLIVVDYLQLMTLSKEDKKSKRNEEVGFISRTLKAIAKELNLPIIALAQLNRGVENKGKGSRKPQMSDLAESGNIEQDADLILFVHREEYYDPEAMTAEGVSLKGKGELILRKHRNGEVGDVYVNFDGTTVRYFDDHSIDSTKIHAVMDYNSRFEKDFTDEF